MKTRTILIVVLLVLVLLAVAARPGPGPQLVTLLTFQTGTVAVDVHALATIVFPVPCTSPHLFLTPLDADGGPGQFGVITLSQYGASVWGPANSQMQYLVACG